MSILDYIKKTFSVRVRINASELLMLEQLINKCKPGDDLSDYYGERQAVHTFAKKLHIPLVKVRKAIK